MTEQTYQQKLVDAKSLGKILSVSQRQVFRLKSSGRLPLCLKLGGAVRWRRSDIDLWLELGCPDVFEFEKRREGL